jgi:hypothetical protein
MWPFKYDTCEKGIMLNAARGRKAGIANQIALDIPNSSKPQTAAINESQIYIQISQALNASSVSRVPPHRGMNSARVSLAIDSHGGLSKPQKQSITFK